MTMINKTKRACQVCGKPFYGGDDSWYCPDRVKSKKMDAVVKIRVCQDCGVGFYGGLMARRRPDLHTKRNRRAKVLKARL